MKTLHILMIIGITIAGIIATIIILQTPHIQIKIEKVNGTYVAGTPIDFFVTADGYGEFCMGPEVHILDATNQSNVVWWGSSPAYSGMYCNPHQVEFTFHAGEQYVVSLHTNRPIILNNTGHYIIKASLGNTFSEKEFSVIPSVNTRNNNPFGITALVIYHPFLGCLSSGCPHNNFYLKINSNSTAYLTGYNICNKDLCAKNNTLSVLLPLNAILKNPNYASIELPENLKWKDGDTVTIQLEVSPNANNKMTSSIDLGNSTIVP
ncbi:hypothetical protein [Candidatus Nitrosotalea okcheonensis]|uniref:Uncharacterized protein n=1 Tax=Candidatus Nitrosotalea okcheonensis TaxID=1903276 RepID=A0A2H1FJ01_9ARCH|nr:hypothetical protein [Candidatus Nitrosotalea okcheonensis]SMH72663.1 protein of unknown function [Candidatus Nitrosotalea okcheonensis]